MPAVVELPAHTTPLGLMFQTGTQFPASYRQALFVSMKGSSTIPNKVGCKLVLVLMKDGRPGGLVTGADGALCVADDNKGFIYRISYAH